MKKIIIAIFIVACSAVNVFGQDILTLKTGEELEVIVTEIGQGTVWYKKYSNPDGPVYSIPQSTVFMIKYPNGEKDVFASSQLPIAQLPQPQYYKQKEPVAACLLSMLLPGGGQYYNGQYGKGAVMTGIWLASIIGLAASLQDTYDNYYDYGYGSHYENDNSSAAGFFILLYMGNYLWSIIDAPIVANKINKTGLLSWNLDKNTRLSVRPNVDITTTSPLGNSFYSPNFGAKLVLSLK